MTELRTALPLPESASVDRDAEREGIELALAMGQLLMDHGAESEVVEQAVRTCGASLGCRWEAVLVTYRALIVTAQSNDGYRTKVRPMGPRAVNMSLLETVSQLNQQLAAGKLSAAQLRNALRELEHAPRHYSPALTSVAVGLACGAFCRIFQGDWPAFAATFAGTAGAMWVRHHYAKRTPNRLIFAAVSACVAGSIVSGLQMRFALSGTPSAAFVACVLMLVPGVPAINAVQDLLRGHVGVALARATETLIILLAAALGLILSLHITQVPL
jgi:uncharacterized membrane protein YjjP (DUF1212 family)